MIIGGFAHDSLITKSFLTSVTYVQDDLTWCVHRADVLPEYLNIFRVSELRVWLLFFVVLCLGGIILYAFSRSDRSINHRHKNIYYMVVVTLFPMSIASSVNTRFKPSRTVLRLFYGLCLFCGILSMSMWSSFLLKTTLHTFRSAQISSVDQLLYKRFDFSTSPAFYQVIFDQEKVIEALSDFPLLVTLIPLLILIATVSDTYR